MCPQNESSGKIYQIGLKGYLSERWSDWFDGMIFSYPEENVTILTGVVLDQAALHGLLKKIRDLSIPLLSVNQIDVDRIE